MNHATRIGSARVVVVGGGVGGCSVAYHLAKLGVRDVLLLERSVLSSGTTWHSTGNMETYREDALAYAMVRYGVEAIAQVQQESGQDVGWRCVGRVLYTDSELRMEKYRAMPETGRLLGIEAQILTPAEVARRLPIIDPAGLVGGVWIPNDARLNPTDLVMAFAKAARRRGAEIREHCGVQGLVLQDGRVCGAVTDAGTIECDTLIVAAGLWSNEILASCGLRLPLHALEHQYLITEPVPGVDATLPLFLSWDDQLYGREEVGGLIVGSLDDGAIPISAQDIPGELSFSLLNERWEQFEPYLATAMRRFPALRTTGAKMLLNGPESFTHDGRMLLGPVPGAHGLYSACGFNSNGIALSSAAGRYLAEWIVEGAPSIDVTPLDTRRFAPVQATEAFIRERVTEIPGYSCGLHAATDDYRTARGIRRSPTHHLLAAAGAQFRSIAGWETAAWIAPPAGESDWIEAVSAEVAAAQRGVVVFDLSSDVKLALDESLAGWLRARIDRLVPKAADAAWCAMQGMHGGAECLVRLLPSANAVLLTASADQEQRLAGWLRSHAGAAGARFWNVTSAHALWELHGPRRHELLQALTSASGAPAGWGFAGAVLVEAYEDSLLGVSALLLPADCACYVWERMLELSAGFGLRVGGHFAREALRVQRRVPRFGTELTPWVSLRPTERRPRLLALTTRDPVVGFGSGDLVIAGGEVVGRTTSRAGLARESSAHMLALVEATTQDAELEVLIGRRRLPVAARAVERWPIVVAPHQEFDNLAYLIQ